MPLKPHPTDPDKMVYVSRQYDIPQLQGLTTAQRPWVGLTAQEAAECWTTSATQTWKNFEAKLKDKNNG